MILVNPLFVFKNQWTW